MRSTIVCVDDELSILKSLGEQLKRNFGEAYDIELADSGDNALLLCDELTREGKEIALVISDQMMQGMTGDKFLIQLHARYPKTLKVMLTGHADADSVGNVVNAAALYRYIRKPWDETDLILTISEALHCFEQERTVARQNELLKETNLKLESALALLRATLEATADGILVLDSCGNVVSFNQKFLDIWGLPASTLGTDGQELIQAVMSAVTESDAIALKTLLKQSDTKQTACLKLENGQFLEYHLQPQQLTGRVVGTVWSFRDVTEEKRSEATIRHQASHDRLTNLPNRFYFEQAFEAVLRDSTVDTKSVAIMFLDLDRFKAVNDQFGHTVGDRLLQDIARRLSRGLREKDVIARWGGDEFVILLPQIRGKDDVSEIASRLIDACQPEFCLNDTFLSITVSIGIAVYPEDGLDIHTLIHNSDTALYQAKRSGRNNYQYYVADKTV
ncbi:MAG: diguanylate cyclase [Cyanobacteria bacterium J06638_22]